MTQRTGTGKSERRSEPLTHARIVEAAVELLDAAGAGGLTFRALTELLATGPGAIYHHVANKTQLLEAATDLVVSEALAPPADQPAAAPRSPRTAIRAVALGLFDAIDLHPWLAAQLAAQLSRSPGSLITARLIEAVGRQVHALGVPEGSRFTVTTALVHYALGAAGQNAANGRAAANAAAASGAAGAAAAADGTNNANRGELLNAISKAWRELDPEQYPFTRAVVNELREHDDREQFLAGIDLILAGIAALYRADGTL